MLRMRTRLRNATNGKTMQISSPLVKLCREHANKTGSFSSNKFNMAKHGKTWQNMVKHVKRGKTMSMNNSPCQTCWGSEGGYGMFCEPPANVLSMFFFIFVECFMNTILFVNLSNLCGENDEWQNISNETKKCNQHLKDKRFVCLKIKVQVPSHLRICFKLQK